MNTIFLKNGVPYIDYKPVRNVKNFMDAMKNKFKGKKDFMFPFKELPHKYDICGIVYVPDGDHNFFIRTDQLTNIPFGVCHCGVPNDVHGTCCGWSNAIFTIDDTLRICDDRHPFYNKNANDWINSQAFRLRKT